MEKNTMLDRAVKACERFLELRGLEVLCRLEENGHPYIAADDEGELVVARVAVSEEGMPGEGFDRAEFEAVAAKLIAERDEDVCTVRGDLLDLHVIGANRAFLRHTRNASHGFNEAA